MATKKTDKSKDTKNKAATAAAKAAKAKAASKKVAAAKREKAPKGEAKVAGPRHPKGRADAAGGKASLAKSIAPALVRGDEGAADVEARLKTASNAQLLRLQKIVTTVEAKWGSRDKLIAAIGTAENKSKDNDYLASLATFSLPQLVDIAVAHERRARA